jgi:ElaB/YqjD/DUF883 family membrane-anchored ribosome-binding protein
METRSTQEIEDSMEKLLEDLNAVIEDGEDLLKSGMAELTARGVGARERLTAALEIAKDTRRKLQARAAESARAADRFVHRNPYQSIGLAFGAGLLVGLLASRR